MVCSSPQCPRFIDRLLRAQSPRLPGGLPWTRSDCFSPCLGSVPSTYKQAQPVVDREWLPCFRMFGAGLLATIKASEGVRVQLFGPRVAFTAFWPPRDGGFRRGLRVLGRPGDAAALCFPKTCVELTFRLAFKLRTRTHDAGTAQSCRSGVSRPTTESSPC